MEWLRYLHTQRSMSEKGNGRKRRPEDSSKLRDADEAGLAIAKRQRPRQPTEAATATGDFQPLILVPV
jgi:hypothetical protein